jgi:hypothetical protein
MSINYIPNLIIDFGSKSMRPSIVEALEVIL